MIEDDVNIDAGVISKFLEELPDKAWRLGTRVVLAVIVLLIGIQLIKILRKILKKSLRRANVETGIIQFLDSFLKVACYFILIIMIAGSFGLDATSILALLGSAGVAIGLAVQGSLSNFAGGILILLVKPFRVGDYILEDSKKNEGIVTEIQIFYTKLTTLDEKTIILPNGSLANTSLTNFTQTKSRRIDLKVGIAYTADLLLAKKVISKILLEDKSVLQDKDSSVFVEDLADSAVMIGIRCYVLNADYLTTKYRLLEQVKLQFDAHQIEISYPQLDVHLTSTVK
ncbi:MAG: mechanosensitive ion channel [Lachnospiraceae bacterium]